jgi:mRNA interferase MazF
MFLYQQKDIILVAFPFTDASTSKQRPVLIVSSDEINRSDSGDFIGLAITSKPHQGIYSVAITNKNCQDGKLSVESEIQCCKIATIQKDKVIKKLCKLREEPFLIVLDKIKRALRIK